MGASPCFTPENTGGVSLESPPNQGGAPGPNGPRASLCALALQSRGGRFPACFCGGRAELNGVLSLCCLCVPADPVSYCWPLALLFLSNVYLCFSQSLPVSVPLLGLIGGSHGGLSVLSAAAAGDAPSGHWVGRTVVNSSWPAVRPGWPGERMKRGVLRRDSWLGVPATQVKSGQNNEGNPCKSRSRCVKTVTRSVAPAHVCFELTQAHTIIILSCYPNRIVSESSLFMLKSGIDWPEITLSGSSAYSVMVFQ